jgi:hypothetical protein
MLVYLAFTQCFGQPHVSYQTVTVANQETDTSFCSTERPQFETALFVAEGLMLAGSFRVCWEIRNVPDIVNESKQISTGTNVHIA